MDLKAAFQRKQGAYPIRTHHLDAMGQPVYINALILEDSPYLLQHAHNPVNWYSWNTAAFEKALQENKPVFLSIGYSTCHWCHVMEEESFDDLQVAEVLNQHFISIKVDREQHPEIDEIYMTGVQIISGHGGWPMSSFLTPEGKPFYAGTYYPKADFIFLLKRIYELWIQQRNAIIDNSEQIFQAIESRIQLRQAASKLSEKHLHLAVSTLLNLADVKHGGFGSAPKFPQETSLFLLLNSLERSDHPTTEPQFKILSQTLNAMLRGGIYDQIGGGFHRYATDVRWLIPHFEKMLYNQAQLARIYARAWRIMHNPEYERIVRETLDYVVREMSHPQGAFYSATDADSEGEEGRFFIWKAGELEQILSDAELKQLKQAYDLEPEYGVLYLQALELPENLQPIKQKLYAHRQERIPPFKDEKIITEWNGLMITAFAEASMILNEPAYRTIAEKAAHFIWNHGQQYRIYLNGQTSIPATLADIAAFMEALLRLYDATHDQAWLNKARQLCRQMIDSFWDETEGGFYASRQQTDTPAIARTKPLFDSASPSGNALALHALVLLQQRAFDPMLNEIIEKQIRHFSGIVDKAPEAACYFLTGVMEFLAPTFYLDSRDGKACPPFGPCD